MGEVFLAQDQLLQRRVAIKEILSGRESGLDPVAVERLIREARLAAGIQHPHVVAVHDLIVENNQTFIVMEYLEARSLAEMIRTQTSLDPLTVAKIGSQVAGALEAAHRAGIIHRDVKPSNILIDADGNAKLADFGVARGTGDANLTGTGMVIGSLAFMSPEVAKGDPAGPAADIFSLGCTLYAAVEGHAPFTDATEPTNGMRTLVRLISETAPPATHAGPLQHLLARMLNPDPKQRPSAGEAQRHLATTSITPNAQDATAEATTEPPAPHTATPDPTPAPNPSHHAETIAGGTQLVTNHPTTDDYAEPEHPATPPTPPTGGPDPAQLSDATFTVPRMPRQNGTTRQEAPYATITTPATPTHTNTEPKPASPTPKKATDGSSRDPEDQTDQSANLQPATSADGGRSRPHRWRPFWLAVAALTALAAVIWGLGYQSLARPRPASRVVATINVGKAPLSAVAADDGTVYVANSGDNTVSIIRGDQVTKTIGVGSEPWVPRVAADGTVYVANSDDGTVSVIRGDQVTKTIKVGKLPVISRVAADGTVYAANSGADTVSVIKDDKVTATITVGKQPTLPRVGPDGTVYVANSSDGTVSVIKDNKVTDTITVGTNPLPSLVAADGTVYVGNSNDGTVSVIKDDKVAATITVGKEPTVPLAADGSVYVSNYGESTVSVVRNDRVTATITVGENPSQPVVAKDGTVYVSNFGEGTVSVISSGQNITTVTVGSNPLSPEVSPDGRVYVSNSGDGTVSVLA